MGLRITCSKCLAICLALTFILTCFIGTLPIPSETEALPRTLNTNRDAHRLAVLIPFRDRFEELLDFVPHMHDFLKQQRIDYHIFVLQQRDGNRFNRASLINVGFLYTRKDFDYIAMHDVDLLPMNPKLSYAYPADGPFHVSSPELHPRYHYPTFIGGILLINREHFKLVNGMSNRYWGWGLEDDEFYIRLKEAGLKVQRPKGLTTGTNDTFRHVHDRLHRRRDTRKCYNQREVTRKRDRQTGLHDVRYRIDGKRELTVDGLPVTVVDVHLQCNVTATPWCNCPEQKKVEKNDANKKT